VLQQELPASLDELRQMPLGEALRIVREVIRQVASLHAHGLIHRAIRWDTVARDGSVRLSEPAPLALLGAPYDPETCPPEWPPHAAVELPAEIASAREALRTEDVELDPRRIDAYQIAVLLCRLATGDSVASYLRSPRVASRLAPEGRELLDRALGYHAPQRFADFDQFAAAVDESLARLVDSDPTSNAALTAAREADGPQPGSLQDAGEPPFRRLGGYEIGERIGRGGMGDVYRAHDPALMRTVAIKVLPPELAREEEFLRRFRAEAAAAARLAHPNIVPIYSVGEDAGVQFFVMQYVEGESLAERLSRRKRLEMGEALEILEQTVSGLAAAHKQGLIHRDIKPGNILIDREQQRAMLADFGLAKAADAAAGDRTATGVILGTMDYISPEQGRGRAVDARSDLYSVGVLIFQLLSGRLPFEAESATAMIFQHVYEPPPDLCEAVPGTPARLGRLVARLLAKDPDERWATADDVLRELRAIQGEPSRGAGAQRTEIVRAPVFDGPAPLSPQQIHALLEAPARWWGVARSRALSIVRRRAPQIIERLENTQQQVDGAVAEYQRRRDRLAQLVEEAEAAGAELRRQAELNRGAAKEAERLESASADERQMFDASANKVRFSAAAESLERQADEQEEQLVELRRQRDQFDATLARTRAQRDALQARLWAAQAQLGPEKQPRRKGTAVIAAALGATLVLGLLAYAVIMWPRPAAGFAIDGEVDLSRGPVKVAIDESFELAGDWTLELDFFAPAELTGTQNLFFWGDDRPERDALVVRVVDGTVEAFVQNSYDNSVASVTAPLPPGYVGRWIRLQFRRFSESNQLELRFDKTIKRVASTTSPALDRPMPTWLGGMNRSQELFLGRMRNVSLLDKVDVPPPDDGQIFVFAGDEGAPSGALIAPDREAAFAIYESGRVRKWSLSSGRETRAFAIGMQGEIAPPLATTAGNRLLFHRVGGPLSAWNYTTNMLANVPQSMAWETDFACLSDDGQRLLVTSKHGFGVYDLATDKPLLTDEYGPITAGAFSKNGRQVIVGDAYGAGKVWEIASGNVVKKFVGGPSPLAAVDISADGLHFLSASGGPTIQLWRVDRPPPVHVFDAAANVTRAEFVFGDRRIISQAAATCGCGASTRRRKSCGWRSARCWRCRPAANRRSAGASSAATCSISTRAAAGRLRASKDTSNRRWPPASRSMRNG
jgi:serine/threonine protein kinase